jgi:hypothetical protein
MARRFPKIRANSTKTKAVPRMHLWDAGPGRVREAIDVPRGLDWAGASPDPGGSCWIGPAEKKNPARGEADGVRRSISQLE